MTRKRKHAESDASIQVEGAEKQTDEKWLNLFNLVIRKPGGERGTWQMASRRQQPRCIDGDFSSPDAVIIVPLHIESGKLVTTREFRVPLCGCEYGFPAGLVEDGESVAETAERELEEETGLQLVRVLRTSPPIFSSAGMTDESVAMIYVECEGRPLERAGVGSEQIEVQMLSRDEAARLCENHNVKFDAKAWLVVSAFARYGEI